MHLFFFKYTFHWKFGWNTFILTWSWNRKQLTISGKTINVSITRIKSAVNNMAVHKVNEAAISLRNTPYLVRKLLLNFLLWGSKTGSSIISTISILKWLSVCTLCLLTDKIATSVFFLHKSWLKSDLIWQKVNVFLLQTDSGVKGKLGRPYCRIKKDMWKLCAQDGAWRGGLQAGRHDKEHQQSWHRWEDCQTAEGE